MEIYVKMDHSGHKFMFTFCTPLNNKLTAKVSILIFYYINKQKDYLIEAEYNSKPI